MSSSKTPTKPSKIKLHKKQGVLDVEFPSGYYQLSAEFLRVHSPSAEVQGHGPGQEVLQHGKRFVNIEKLEAAGHYGLRIYFDDEHNTGLYSWKLLEEMGVNQESLWQAYLDKLHQAGKSRDPHESAVKIIDFP